MNTKLSSLAAALILASAVASAQTPAKPVAKVNGVAVSPAAVELMTNEQIAQGAPNDENLKAAVKDELVRRELLAQEARKRGLDKRAEIITRMDMARQGILVGAYINDWVKANPVTDAKVRAEYDRQVANMASTEYDVRHIQLATEAQAQAVIKKLQEGAKFEDLAKDSIDTGSAANGGKIGWVSPKGLPAPFGDAVAKLEQGKFTSVPVQTQYGYHVIMVDGSRKATPPAFDAEKDNLRHYLEQQALTSHINDLLKKAKVE